METISFKDFLEKQPATGDYIVGYDSVTNEEIRILFSALIQTPAPGASVQIQYTGDISVANPVWHFPFQTGDVYMRQRLGTAEWSSPIQMSLTQQNIEDLAKSIETEIDIDSIKSDIKDLQTNVSEKANLEDLTNLEDKFEAQVQSIIISEDNTGVIDKFVNATYIFYCKDYPLTINVGTDVIAIKTSVFLKSLSKVFVGETIDARINDSFQRISFVDDVGNYVECVRCGASQAGVWTEWIKINL